MNKENYTLLCDFYELTMSNGYFKSDKANQMCYFDVFFRNVPDNGGFAIACGLETIVNYIKDLKFTSDDIEYLRSEITKLEKRLFKQKNSSENELEK